MSAPIPFMAPDEVAFLAAYLKPTDRVWEWGSGDSTRWLAKRCRYVTTVEHQPWFAASVLQPPHITNMSLLYVPPQLPYVEGTEDDGDDDTFHRYVRAFTGDNIDVVLVDGRARVACVRQVVEGAAFGPAPGLRVFLHDCDREQYATIWRDDPDKGWRAHLREVKRVGRLMLLEPRAELNVEPFEVSVARIVEVGKQP